MNDLVRNRIRVEGIVQGVGFRPFVHSLATRLRLAGQARNDVHGVSIDIEGPRPRVDHFLAALRDEAPPIALIERITVEDVEPIADAGFHILPSDGTGIRETLVAADYATCPDCLREMSDPGNRRFAYPFTNCTNCGPRFTIIRGLPYDRPLTTMAEFAMCTACQAEYHDPDNRRFHAQPVCCPDCGPNLRLVDRHGLAYSGDSVQEAAAALARGEILAVKGLGGYHLAVDATNEDAVLALRKRKHRDDKPFAVMVADERQARSLCAVDEAEQQLLTSRRRPIVLLDRLPDTRLAAAVAPGNRQLGVMLPYSPVHHLLLTAFSGPIVLTSGNLCDEPMAHLDDHTRDRLSAIADVFLVHDREIHVRSDDSVVRAFRGHQLVLRRSRGYVPEPLAFPWEFSRPVLACGAELKNTFSLAKRQRVFVSHHIGDLENYETLRSFSDGIDHFQRLFEVRPEVVAHDLHPEYLSTKYALERTGVELVGVQHHHAHIASCLADNGERGPVIGVAFDGLGYGTDGTLWGGEFLLADLVGFRRLGHLAPVAMPGGTTAIKQPWRMAVSYLLSCYGKRPPDELDVLRRNDNWREVAELALSGYQSPATSSAGRLFDAVAAILGVRDVVHYEGQAAIELEQLADRGERAAYPALITTGDVLHVSGADLVRAVVDDLDSGVRGPVVSARFHNGVSKVIVQVCSHLRDSTGVSTVALSGGVFQNMLLLHRTVTLLEARGLRPLVHSRVPPNDGGVSLGQATIAGARDRRHHPRTIC